jgi:hypothetical protein
MEKSSLPPVFAVYNRETKLFQIFQKEIKLNGIIYRIKPWVRPVKYYWRACFEETDRSSMALWFQGEQWYAIPKKEEPSHRLHKVRIYNKIYYYWYLNHSLLWASHEFDRKEESQDKWAVYPQVPILEFNTRSLYPNTLTNIQPTWYSTNYALLENESSKGWDLFYSKNTSYPLRIRTPTYKKIETDSESESKSISNSDSYNESKKPYSFYASLWDNCICCSYIFWMICIVGIIAVFI